MKLGNLIKDWNTRLVVTLFMLAMLMGVGLAVGYYQYGRFDFKARKTGENAVILRLVSSFVATYSEQTAKVHDLPVPASFRAMALQKLNEKVEGSQATRIEMVGVPGLEISLAAPDAHAVDVIKSMAAAQSKDVWSDYLSVGGAETLRTIQPVTASEESCVACHNRLQAGIKTWRTGEVMGAYILDAPASAYFVNLWRISAILGFLGFIVVAVIGLLLGRMHGKMNEAMHQEEMQRERESLLETARRQAEDEAHGLSQEVQKVNEELVATNQRLLANLHELKTAQDEIIKSGKMAQLGQLIATVAHEIRNPLGVIRTSVAILERKAAASGADFGKPVARIKNGVERCDTIVNELLDFSRSKSLDLVSSNVDGWLEHAVSEHSERIHPDVAIECHFGLGELEAAFDASRMDRAVCNLISNAAEAMVGKIGKEIENPTAGARVVVSTRLTGRGIEISVRDNGPGISQDNLPKIFDPLFTTKSFGVGLGLPAVQKIFEQHGGGLDVHSTPGEGAEFTGWIRADLKAGQAKAA